MNFLKNNAAVLAGILILLFLMLLPTGFEDAVIYKGADRCAAKVLDTNNSNIIDTGLFWWLSGIPHGFYGTGDADF